MRRAAVTVTLGPSGSAIGDGHYAMRTAIAMGLLLLMAGGARANDEYVNPVFCYRVVQPPDVSRVVARPDGTEITMELAAPCPGPACISFGIAAGYPRNVTDLPHAHEYYRYLGWRLDKPTRRTIAGIPWIAYAMSRGDAALRLYEYTGGRGKAAYVVLAQYPHEAESRVRREITKLLASWRWVSACL